MPALLAMIAWLAMVAYAVAADASAADDVADKSGDSAVTQPSDEQLKFFETRIRPLLARHCYDCHGADVQESDLRLDSLAAMLQGGKAGAVIVPGKPAQSLLVTAVGYRDNTLQMPPEGKLTDREVADLTRWVASGAPYPGEQPVVVRKQTPVDLDEARQFWAFQPPRWPALPEVRNAAWPRNELDYFVLARLEAAGLQPAPAADKPTLLRRATFDLTGLPPAGEEIEAFLADDSPDAFARVVDRLLASSAYGERWGRHWLDVARYADSNGLDENVAHGNAWRYRDYVVNAFNADKPYDRFLIEQLAGDLLPADNSAQRHEQLTATGFLSLGPKGLAEVDKVKLEMDLIDEQIDTVGRAFLGLTLGCVRCHDHKFDPLFATDYYALAGIFRSTKTMESLTTIARWHENPIPEPADRERQAEYDRKVAELEAAIADSEKAAGIEPTPPGKAPANKPAPAGAPPEIVAQLKAQREELAALKKQPPAMPSAMGVTEGRPTTVAIHIRGSHLTLGEDVPRRFPLVLAGLEQPPLPDDRSGRLELAQWMTRPDHPLVSRVMVNRVWRWHFGRGLVDSPDNFGRLGGRPTHPELLDRLALQFIADGWSIKQLHRRIMLSAAYQTGGQPDARALEIDPDNLLLWRRDVRRLDAEELRDALLAVSGRLDRTAGGSLLSTPNYKHIFDHTSKDGTNYDVPRRSIYLPVVRNNMYDLFQLFDYSDASVVNGDRPASTIAPQALFMMNSTLVSDAADALAADLLSDDRGERAGDALRIDRLYRRVLGRSATPRELALGERYLASLETAIPEAAERADVASSPTPAPVAAAAARHPRQPAWSALCQVLLICNEFVTVR